MKGNKMIYSINIDTITNRFINIEEISESFIRDKIKSGRTKLNIFYRIKDNYCYNVFIEANNLEEAKEKTLELLYNPNDKTYYVVFKNNKLKDISSLITCINEDVSIHRNILNKITSMGNNDNLLIVYVRVNNITDVISKVNKLWNERNSTTVNVVEDNNKSKINLLNYKIDNLTREFENLKSDLCCFFTRNGWSFRGMEMNNIYHKF